jgi:hypothetical protein
LLGDGARFFCWVQHARGLFQRARILDRLAEQFDIVFRFFGQGEMQNAERNADILALSSRFCVLPG